MQGPTCRPHHAGLITRATSRRAHDTGLGTQGSARKAPHLKRSMRPRAQHAGSLGALACRTLSRTCQAQVAQLAETRQHMRHVVQLDLAAREVE
eukprot:359987-Chlamydomonas_euryale.AAC.3